MSSENLKSHTTKLGLISITACWSLLFWYGFFRFRFPGLVCEKDERANLDCDDYFCDMLLVDGARIEY